MNAMCIRGSVARSNNLFPEAAYIHNVFYAQAYYGTSSLNYRNNKWHPIGEDDLKLSLDKKVILDL